MAAFYDGVHQTERGREENEKSKRANQAVLVGRGRHHHPRQTFLLIEFVSGGNAEKTSSLSLSLSLSMTTPLFGQEQSIGRQKVCFREGQKHRFLVMPLAFGSELKLPTATCVLSPISNPVFYLPRLIPLAPLMEWDCGIFTARSTAANLS